jgi:hypothetical protein
MHTQIEAFDFVLLIDAHTEDQAGILPPSVPLRRPPCPTPCEPENQLLCGIEQRLSDPENSDYAVQRVEHAAIRRGSIEHAAGIALK